MTYPNLTVATDRVTTTTGSELPPAMTPSQVFSLAVAELFEVDADGEPTAIPLGQSGPFVVQVDAEDILCASFANGQVAVYFDGTTNGRGYNSTTIAAHNPNAPAKILSTSVQSIATGGGGGSANVQTGAGSPVGAVVPTAEGNLYLDTTTPALWQADGLTDEDWKCVVDYSYGLTTFTNNGGDSIQFLNGEIQFTSGYINVVGLLAGEGAPTSVGSNNVGSLYVDTTTPALYQCTATGDPATWEQLGAGGSPVMPMTYNGITAEYPVVSAPAGYDDSGIATIMAQLTTGEELISGLLDHTGNPIPDGFTFPAICFVEGGVIYDLIMLNDYLYSDGWAWYSSGGGQPSLYLSAESGISKAGGVNYFSGGGSPLGVVTPISEGDVYTDNTTPAIYVASQGGNAESWIQLVTFEYGLWSIYSGAGDIFQIGNGEVGMDSPSLELQVIAPSFNDSPNFILGGNNAGYLNAVIGGSPSDVGYPLLPEGEVSLPFTVTTGVNDTFVYSSTAFPTSPETFTVAPGTYYNLNDLCAALNAATGTSSDTFNDWSQWNPGPQGVYIVGTGTEADTLSAGGNDITAGLNFANPTTTTETKDAIGFFGATPVGQQTSGGTLDGVIAALVALGLLAS